MLMLRIKLGNRTPNSGIKNVASTSERNTTERRGVVVTAAFLFGRSRVRTLA